MALLADEGEPKLEPSAIRVPTVLKTRIQSTMTIRRGRSAGIIIAPGFQEPLLLPLSPQERQSRRLCKDLPEAHALPKFHKFHFEMKRCIRGNDTTCATGTVGEFRRNNQLPSFTCSHV